MPVFCMLTLFFYYIRHQHKREWSKCRTSCDSAPVSGRLPFNSIQLQTKGQPGFGYEHAGRFTGNLFRFAPWQRLCHK
jgi:hypothetical protein